MLSKRTVKEAYKRGLRKVFEHGQRAGVSILPKHFYSEIPDIRALRNDGEWKRPFSMIGVSGSEIADQLGFVAQCCTPEVVQALHSKNVHARASEANGEAGFGPIEADFLYAFVASMQPRQIFQIGCGVSTAVCLQAARDAKYHPEVICLEPYPTPYLVEAERRGELRLLRTKAQQLDLDLIENLSDGVLFFVDSTHTLGPAGEVSRIILEMLPRLKPGSWVHFHDIFFPYDYSPDILNSALFFPHESVLLHAFLACNERFSIAASLSMLHHAAPERLQTYLPNYRPAQNDEGLETKPGHFPASTYLRVIP